MGQLFSEADLPDHGACEFAQNAHHLTHQQGGEDGALPDAGELAQENKAQDATRTLVQSKRVFMVEKGFFSFPAMQPTRPSAGMGARSTSI